MISEEIIKVLDDLGNRFGVVIDWSNQNIIPYLQELGERFITYKTATEVGDKKIWIYGDLLQSTELCDTYEISDCTSIDGSRYEVDRNTIGQYTGLKDKNGKDIYEGDILKFSEVDTAIVEWNEKYAYFMIKPIQDYYFDSDVLGDAIEYSKVEVIGNIYENIDLLKD